MRVATADGRVLELRLISMDEQPPMSRGRRKNSSKPSSLALPNVSVFLKLC